MPGVGMEELVVGQERSEEIRRLKVAGMTVSGIARASGLDKKTVRRCLQQVRWQAYRRPARREALLDTHRGWLAERAAQVGYSARILYQELCAQRGFEGGYGTVRQLLPAQGKTEGRTGAWPKKQTILEPGGEDLIATTEEIWAVLDTVRWGAEIHIGEGDAARLDGIIAYSYVPLRLAYGLGAVVFTLSFVLASVYFLQRLLADEFIPQGFTTLAILVLFLGGVQLLTIGLLGEYIGRIYDEVKRRAEFVERELIGFASSEDGP